MFPRTWKAKKEDDKHMPDIEGIKAHTDDGKRKKKIEGIFRTAFAHSISKQIAQRIELNDEKQEVAQAASKILADFLIRGKDGMTLGIDSESSTRTGKKGGMVHDLLLNQTKSQLTWYLTGTTGVHETKNSLLSSPPTPLAYTHLVQISSTFVPSSTVFHALHPTIVWVPEIIQKPIASSIASTLPLAQNSLDMVTKSYLEWVLLDEEWRSWTKDLTNGYIKQQSSTAN